MIKHISACVAFVSVALGLAHGQDSKVPGQDLKKDLLFYSSFNNGLKADHANGDDQLYWAPSIAFPPAGKPGLPPGGSVSIAKGEGKFGDALRFHKNSSEMVYFRADKNIGYNKTNWNGTVSFWLKLNPDKDLQPGFSDPIQITSKSWNNAAFFVEFSKDEKPREFRLGAYADFEVWNPTNRDWNAIPFAEKPLVKVVNPPFSREKWTFVAFTFSNYNTGKTDGETILYLNGKKQGSLSPRNQMFTIDMDKGAIMLGLSYIGLWDELGIFNRALTEQELTKLFAASESLVSQ
ncbi:MAG: LamG-like jellyroll fold domain-containing protein [Verrucomicrobiales bacterium]